MGRPVSDGAARRRELRRRKKTVRQGIDRQASAEQRVRAGHAALELLMHSVRMRHDRLALIRLGTAVRCGVVIPASLWRYCEQVAERLGPADLERLLRPLLQATASGHTE